MNADDVYVLTPSGESELRSGMTRLSPEEINVLVRIDGQLSVANILRTVPPEAQGAFTKVLVELRKGRYVEHRVGEPDTLQWPSEPAGAPSLGVACDAEAGLSSLRRRGFYVQMARERFQRRTRVDGQGLTAVVIDDEPMFARFTATLLRLSGFDVRQAGNKAEAAGELRRLPLADVVLLDVQLPDVDGFDVLRGIRAHSVLKDVPVVMLTAEATRESVLKGFAEGADGYITKPADPETLIRAVQAVLGLHRELGAVS